MDAETTIHPNPIPDHHYRKIELQSPQDLTYLQTNLIAAARQKLDLHFPPSAAQHQRKPQPATFISLDGVKPAQSQQEQQQKQPGDEGAKVDGDEDEDPLRASVRAYVDAYISRVYSYAGTSVTVNGLDATSLPPTILTTKSPTPIPATDAAAASPSAGPREEKEGVDFDYEAHDTRLQKRVAELYAELESLTSEVGKLRRTAPKQGAETTGDLLREILGNDDVQFEREMEAIKAEGTATVQATDGGGILKLQPLSDAWFEERRMLYERGVSELGALAGLASTGAGKVDGNTAPAARGPSLTETVGRAQRARTVAMELD